MMTKKNRKKFCPKCGKVIKSREKFCSRCGNKISNGAIAGARIGQNWVWITVSVVAVAVLITVVVAGMNSNKQKAVDRTYNSPQIASIVSAFDCSCGNCDKTLADCDCPTAKETNEYISERVAKNKYSRREIIEMVNNKYGHLINKKELEG
jgi:hypothetical protein